MPGGIFLLDPDGGLTEMAETAFSAEVDLQELLARHPGLLPGDQIDPESPRRWLLVAREVSVPDVPASDFWQRVKTNLQAGKIRLIFVADTIPSELRRIVEFLNQQMDPAEVLAVEIRQYAGGALNLKTLVPRVMGQTSEALVRKTGGGRIIRQWDEPSFFAELTARRGEAEAEAARRILRWAEQKRCRIWWGRGVQSGSFLPMVDYAGEQFWTLAVWTYGTVEIQFVYMRRRRPFDAEEKRRELRDRLNAVPGISIPAEGIERRPNVPLQALTLPGALARFLEALDWVVDEIRLDPAST